MEDLAPSLGSDNHSGVHPAIFTALMNCNQGHAPSYGTDPWTQLLTKTFKGLFGQSCDPQLVFNGTAANVLCLNALVQSHQSVVCTDVSHLNVDECGAPEKHIGCKLVPVPSIHGKLTVDDIKRCLIRRGDQHYSQVAAVSITQPTELGTLYTLEEMGAIAQFCKENKLYFHIDGARLIYAPVGLGCDFLDLGEKLGVDAISFGGTKNGLLFGEACLLFNREASDIFKYQRKQMMQLPSKQRFLACQFLALFENELWREIAQTSHQTAAYLRKQIATHLPGWQITQPTEANSVFVKIPRDLVKTLRRRFFFYVWDENTFEVRLMTSFDVSQQMIDDFISEALNQ